MAVGHCACLDIILLWVFSIEIVISAMLPTKPMAKEIVTH